MTMEVNDLPELNARQVQQVTEIVRTEVLRAVLRLAASAEHLDMPYDTDREDSNVYQLIAESATRAALGIKAEPGVCEHVYENVSFKRWLCIACGTPSPGSVPADPFKEN